MKPDITFYDWVKFFDSICKGIIEIGADNSVREQKLFELARATFHADHAILKYSTIDPFSYIYALAQRNTKNQRQQTFQNVKIALGIIEDIPTDFIFPTPTPNTLSLFFSNGNYYDRNGANVGNECLWDLFTQVYLGNAIVEADFQKVLSLKNVGFTKLSQAMFLINPKKYMPFDTQMNSLPISNLNNLKLVVSKIEAEGIPIYLKAIDELKQSFPGCELYEINLLNVLINSTDSDQLRVSNKYCQASSWADGQDQEDYFNNFVNQNSVWTGGATSESGNTKYPLTNYKMGDIVLVRRGTKNLGGIGIILRNEYIPNGYDSDSVIKIIWIAKANRKIDGTALGQRVGFWEATTNTIEKFEELYPESFDVLQQIRNKQKVMINHSTVKYKNLILQGPPGTGKTRLAKQIAEWLIDETEKQQSLIEAIDTNTFVKEPDIEGKEQINLIQFHPSYTYEDFVRGIKADAQGDRIKYVVENRILAKFAEEASKPENQKKAYVLIIDEINRANLTSVLGELIYAMEYRGQKVNSMYEYNGSNEISLPHNLYIIGTMNTADRSVSHIDYAIRRRFTFIPVLPKESVVTNTKAKQLYKAIKLIFDEFTSPEFNKDDIQIGHSYFLFDDAEITMKLKYEIKPLLQEYIKDGVLLESAKDKIADLNA